MPESDFCPTGNCPDANPDPDPGLPFELTADQEAHLAVGGALHVRDTRRKFLKRGGKIAAAIAAVGVLGKVTAEKVEAATCAGLYCPYGQYYTGYYQNRSPADCPQGVSCWHYVKCCYDSTYCSYYWCKAYCGYC